MRGIMYNGTKIRAQSLPWMCGVSMQIRVGSRIVTELITEEVDEGQLYESPLSVSTE